MEEVNRTPQPGETPPVPGQPPADRSEPAPRVRLEPGAFSGSWRLHRNATVAAARALYARPGLRGARRAVLLADLVLPLFCLVAGFSLLFQGIQPAGWFCAVPWIVYILLIGNPLYQLIFWRLWRSLRHFGGATLDATHLHLDGPDGGRDYPLADLTLLCRFRHWTALVWQHEEELVVLPIPDSACPDGGETLVDRLRQAAPNVAIVRRSRLLLLGAYLLCLLQMLVFFVSFLLFAQASLGLQYLTSLHWQGGTTVMLVYDHRSGLLFLPGQDAVPVAGEPVFHWPTDRCCTVTYYSPDGVPGVAMIDGTADQSADRLDPDPPTGSWAQYPIFSDPGITLQWDAGNGCYRLLTNAGESVYTDWQTFDGLGLALCDENGQPEWTLTADHGKFWDPDNVKPEGPVLELCRVTMDDYIDPIPLYPFDGEASTPDSAAPAATPVPAEPTPAPTPEPAPTFDETVDVCLNEGGLYFTWDGGASWRELPVNFASSGLTVATRLTDFAKQGDEWRMTVTQEPYGREDLVFRANAPDGPWAYVKP